VVKEGGKGDPLRGRHRGMERVETREGFELERVASCRSREHRRRTKLDFSSGESFDDHHRPHTWGKTKDRSDGGGELLLGWRAREQLEASARWWHVCGWPGSRSSGYARNLRGGRCNRKRARTHQAIESSTSVRCCAWKSRQRKRDLPSATRTSRWLEMARDGCSDPDTGAQTVGHRRWFQIDDPVFSVEGRSQAAKVFG